MKILEFRLTIFAVWVIGIACPAHSEPKATDAFEQNRKLGRGVNILGYDPIWRDRAAGRFQAKYFRELKEAGFNSVRVNLYPFRGIKETNNWHLSPEWLGTADWVVEQAGQEGLMVILDFHEYETMGENPAANKARFLEFWREFASHYKDAPASVVFEILNEPSRNLTPPLWNEYLHEALSVIRKSNPNRTVIAGPAFYNSFEHLGELELPANDRNLIVTVHYYLPMDFTHQGAPWAGRKDKVGVEWLGTEQERAAIRSDFEKVTAWAKEHKRPLFLGEFGAYDKGPMESRARYTASVARAAEAQGWSWAYWQFDSDFILYDVRHDKFVEPILHALIPTNGVAH
jgi:endoglucanase